MGISIINYGDIIDFLKARAQEEENPHPRLGELLDLALTKAIAKDVQFCMQVTEYPDPAPKWLTREEFDREGAGPFYKFDPDLLSREKDRLDHIVDWIGGALKDDDAWVNTLDGKGRPIKLVPISSIDDAYICANKDMRAKANRLRGVFADSDNRFSAQEEAGDIKTVKTLSDGSRIVQLLTSQALDYETSCIDHCIGNGNYDDQVQNLDKFQYYSFRDAQNKAHATLEVKDGVLEQCKGKGNAPPIEKYFIPIQEFIKEQKWEIIENPKHTGLLKHEGRFYDMRNLPDPFDYEGKIDVSEVKWLTHFPSMPQITDLSAWGLVNLTTLGDMKNIKKLDVSGNVNLKKLGDMPNLEELFVSDCDDLVKLPEGLCLRNLGIDFCESLKQFPKNFTLKQGGRIFWRGHAYKDVDVFRAEFEEEFPPHIHDPDYIASVEDAPAP